MKKSCAKHLGYYELLEAFHGAKGCALCEVEVRDTRHYLDGLLYENVNDGGVRDALVRSGGYCRRHAYLLLGFGNALGTAILYQDQIRLMLQTLRSRLGGSRRSRKKGAGPRLSDAETCPACGHERDRRDGLLNTLVEWFSEPQMRAAVAAGPGLCMPHLFLLLDRLQDPAVFDDISALHIDKLSSLDAELAELIRKHDYRFRAEGFGDERDAWSRAAKLMVGHRDIL